jgi:hypothetical protein
MRVFKSEDLPTLERPRKATIGSLSSGRPLRFTAAFTNSADVTVKSPNFTGFTG